MRLRQATAALYRHRIGAVPKKWGLLSDTTETLLPRIVKYKRLPSDLPDRLAALNEQIPSARLLAHDGNPELEKQLTSELAAILVAYTSSTSSAAPADPSVARQLLHHLPAWARPIPAINIAAIRIGDSPYQPYFDYWDPRVALRKLHVSRKTIGALYLHDIGVDEKYANLGLGSAALEHLCRTADHLGISITGQIVPRDRDSEPDSARLANWYRRYGFTVTPADNSSYLHAQIERPPTPARSEFTQPTSTTP